jgi:hypothetical protein
MPHKKKKPRNQNRPHYTRGEENDAPENNENPDKSERKPFFNRRRNKNFKPSAPQAKEKEPEMEMDNKRVIKNQEVKTDIPTDTEIAEFSNDNSTFIITKEIQQRKEEIESAGSLGDCPICELPVKSPATSIPHRETEKLAHFDCVIRELLKDHKDKMGKHRRIYYIGGGNFAIVREHHDKRGRLKTYNIIEKINYAQKE